MGRQSFACLDSSLNDPEDIHCSNYPESFTLNDISCYQLWFSGYYPLVYECQSCAVHLLVASDIISRKFRGSLGVAYLVKKLFNVEEESPIVERMMMTGSYLVNDVHCAQCGIIIGWRYHSASHPSEKYKEGHYGVERTLLKKVQSPGPILPFTFLPLSERMSFRLNGGMANVHAARVKHQPLKILIKNNMAKMDRELNNTTIFNTIDDHAKNVMEKECDFSETEDFDYFKTVELFGYQKACHLFLKDSNEDKL